MKLKKLIRLTNPANWFRRTQSGESVKSYGGYATILLNPVYEPVTRVMSNWFEGLRIPSGFGKVLDVSGAAANRLSVEKALADTRGLKRIKIFCGHGVDHALLGPPQTGEAIIRVGDIDHSGIYDAALVEPGQATLFAFCCSSGKELGKKFASLKFHTFLGYEDELPIETANEECSDALKNIFRTIAAAVIDAGEVLPEHELRLKNLYHEAYLYFFQGEGRHNKRARYMWLALNEHRRLICRYGGKL